MPGSTRTGTPVFRDGDHPGTRQSRQAAKFPGATGRSSATLTQVHTPKGCHVSLKDKVVDGGVGALNRRIHATSHAEGMELLETTIFFATDAPKTDLLAAIRRGVKVEDAPSLITEGLYESSVEGDRVQWTYGKKMASFFVATAVVGVEAGLEDGTRQHGVLFSIGDGHTVDGVVHPVSAMRALTHDVETSLRSVDAEVDRVVWSA